MALLLPSFSMTQWSDTHATTSTKRGGTKQETQYGSNGTYDASLASHVTTERGVKIDASRVEYEPGDQTGSATITTPEGKTIERNATLTKTSSGDVNNTSKITTESGNTAERDTTISKSGGNVDVSSTITTSDGKTKDESYSLRHVNAKKHKVKTTKEDNQ